MFGIGVPELLLIALTAALLFGPERLAGVAHSLGRFSGEFKKGRAEIEDEVRSLRSAITLDEHGDEN